MLWKRCTQYTSKFGKLSSGQRTGKGEFSFQSQEGQCQRMLTLLLSCTHFTQNKVMLNILQGRPQQYMNGELPDVQAGFRRGRGTRDQIANICWIIEKQENSRKASTSASLTWLKPLTVRIMTNCGKFLKRWEYQTSWETCIQVKKQQLELDMEQRTGSKLGKEYIKVVYCYPAYLTYMQNTSWKILGYMKHKLNQDWVEKYQ